MTNESPWEAFGEQQRMAAAVTTNPEPDYISYSYVVFFRYEHGDPNDPRTKAVLFHEDQARGFCEHHNKESTGIYFYYEKVPNYIWATTPYNPKKKVQ